MSDPETPNPYGIRFGTDGWRGVIGRDFIFSAVEVVAQAIADYVRSQPTGSRQILVGYDTRFMANRFARRVSEVLASNAFDVRLLDRAFPTPYVSFEVKRRGMAGGVMVTASHNPPEFCGIKFKAPFGGSATPELVKQIESQLYRNPVRRTSSGAEGSVTQEPPGREYFDAVKSRIDFESVRKARLRVVADAMHGAAAGLLETLLTSEGISCSSIRQDPDPLFGGLFPEPMEENLLPLRKAVLDRQADIGLATDGDADRLGVMDSFGNYVNTHQILALLILHLVRVRGCTGTVVKTFSQSVLIERICRKLGLSLKVVPIGFKNIADLMLREDILIGGEESGGVGVRDYIPERDGILINLMVLEAVSRRGAGLRQMVEELWEEFGECHFLRKDLHVHLELGRELVERLRNCPPSRFAGYPLDRVETLDGTKLVFQDESWILFRQSGTEPVLRIYSEAPSLAQVRQLMEEGVRLTQP
ncbi:MAG: phosphoglucomutase/phosphomannomutase family protein [Acidobacteriota bacterium]